MQQCDVLAEVDAKCQAVTCVLSHKWGLSSENTDFIHSGLFCLEANKSNLEVMLVFNDLLWITLSMPVCHHI